MVPDRLEDWSFNRIKGLADKNINESRTHDFKSNLPDSIELTKDFQMKPQKTFTKGIKNFLEKDEYRSKCLSCICRYSCCWSI